MTLLVEPDPLWIGRRQRTVPIGTLPKATDVRLKRFVVWSLVRSFELTGHGEKLNECLATKAALASKS